MMQVVIRTADGEKKKLGEQDFLALKREQAAGELTALTIQYTETNTETLLGAEIHEVVSETDEASVIQF